MRDASHSESVSSAPAVLCQTVKFSLPPFRPRVTAAGSFFLAKTIAKLGAEYFRQLQAKRKKRKGGRPPKSK
jgi:hypothetical protein